MTPWGSQGTVQMLSGLPGHGHISSRSARAALRPELNTHTADCPPATVSPSDVERWHPARWLGGRQGRPTDSGMLGMKGSSSPVVCTLCAPKGQATFLNYPESARGVLSLSPVCGATGFQGQVLGPAGGRAPPTPAPGSPCRSPATSPPLGSW